MYPKNNFLNKTDSVGRSCSACAISYFLAYHPVPKFVKCRVK